MRSQRIIVLINLVKHHAPSHSTLEFDDTHYRIIEHGIGWNFDAANALVRRYDGYADALCVNGLRAEVGVGRVHLPHAQCMDLLQSAKDTPIYLGDNLRKLFTHWTIGTLIKEQPEFFPGRKVLFHAAIASPSVDLIAEAGARIYGGDALTLMGLPLRLQGIAQLERFLSASGDLLQRLSNRRLTLFNGRLGGARLRRFKNWIADCDVFVSYHGILSRLGDLSVLRDKDLLVDYVDAPLRRALEHAGVRNVLELKCHSDAVDHLRSKPFAVLEAIIDQQRRRDDSTLPSEEYTVQQIEKLHFKPHRLNHNPKARRRCAFVIHPLKQSDIYNWPALRPVNSAPERVKHWVEAGLSKVPVFRVGEVSGVVSAHDGQEVVCDLYAIVATPRQLLEMRPERVYGALVRGIGRAEERGALLAGLGAFTKIVGDAGVTVNRQANIPVTTGNSYTVATTLWAARVAVEKMGMISSDRVGSRLRAKVMVIGATGAIGRVSALLTSLAFNEVVLVAPRADRLLELREEMGQLSPDVEVRVATSPDHELSDTDLIVVATSAWEGAVLDMSRVKPGAVICDASRPLNISAAEAKARPDVLVIESGEATLPGQVDVSLDIGLPSTNVYACLAETIILAMEGRYEAFSSGRTLSWEKVKEIYKLGLKHGVQLAAIRGPSGVITDTIIRATRSAAITRKAEARQRASAVA